MRRVLILTLALLGGVLFWMWTGGRLLDSGIRDPQGLLPASQRQAVPQIHLRDLGDSAASIPQEMRGPLLVVFWASW